MPFADPAKKRAYDKSYGDARKAARAARSKAWRDANPDRQRAHQRRHHLKRKFDLSLEEYDALMAKQGGRCAICGTTDTAPWDWFCVDHCHTSGAVRGLLCRACNTCIGQAQDDPEILRKAIHYLRVWSA
jgi:hypothetical protein